MRNKISEKGTNERLRHAIQHLLFVFFSFFFVVFFAIFFLLVFFLVKASTHHSHGHAHQPYIKTASLGCHAGSVDLALTASDTIHRLVAHQSRLQFPLFG